MISGGALSAFFRKLKSDSCAKSPLILFLALGLCSAFFLSHVPHIPVWHDDTTSYLNFEPIRTPFYGAFAHLLINVFGHPFCIIVVQQVLLLLSTIAFCWQVERALKSWSLAVLLGLLIFLKDGSLSLSAFAGPDSIFESLILLMSALMIACIRTKRSSLLALALSTFALGLYLRPAAAALAPGLVLFALIEWWKDRRLLKTSLVGTVVCFGLMSVLNFFQLGFFGWQNVLGTNLMGTTAFIIDSSVPTKFSELRDSIIRQAAPYKAKIDAAKSPAQRRQYFDEFLVDGTWRIGCPRAHDWVNQQHQGAQQSADSLVHILGRRWSECDNALLSLSLSTILKYPQKYAELCVQRGYDYTLRLVSGEWKGDLAFIYRHYYDAQPSFDASRNQQARDKWKRKFGYVAPENLESDVFGVKGLAQSCISWLNPLLVITNVIALGFWLSGKLRNSKEELLLSISAYCALLWLPYFSVVVFLGQYLTRYFDAVVCLLLLGAVSFVLWTSLQVEARAHAQTLNQRK